MVFFYTESPPGNGILLNSPNIILQNLLSEKAVHTNNKSIRQFP